MSGGYGYSGSGGNHLFDTPEERDEFAEMFDDYDDEIEPWRERFYDEGDCFADYEGYRDEVER